MSQEEAPTRSTAMTHVRVRVMVFLCVLSFLTYYDRQCIVRAQEVIQQSLALSDWQLALVLGAFWLAYGLFEIPGGWMGDRYGSRFTLTRIVLAWSVFTALTGAATGFYSLLLYRFLFGMGEAGAYPNMAHVQSRWLPIAERARAGGVLWMCARCGGAFAPLIFGTITRGIDSLQLGVTGTAWFQWFAHTPSWRIAFFVSGGLGVIWCVAFYPWFRDDPAEKKSVGMPELRHIESGRGTIEAGHHMDAGLWGRLFTSPSLWGVTLYYVCGSMGWSFYVSWMPRYLKEIHGVTFEKSEWTLVGPLLCGGIACLVGGFLSDELVRRTGWRRMGRAVFPVSGCSLAAAAMLAIPYVSSHRDAVILMCVASAAYDFGQAATWASVVDIGGRYAGVALGFINMGASLGNALQPSIGERVFNSFGWNTLFGLYAVTFLMAMTTWVAINPTRRFYDRQE
jgi:MFS family permease